MLGEEVDRTQLSWMVFERTGTVLTNKCCVWINDHMFES